METSTHLRPPADGGEAQDGFEASAVEGTPFLEQVAAHEQRGRSRQSELDRHEQLERALQDAVAGRRETERELRATVEELSDFFENAAEALHRVGADGVILSANRAELDMLGYTADEYVGHHVTEFHADAKAAQEILDRLARNETVRDHEARLRCKDGTIKHVLINSNVRFRDGKFVHSRCFTRDITDRKRLEEELRRQNEDLSRTVRFSETFVSILGHDLRNPLSGITTAAALLARRADSERMAKPAVRILNSGRRMARMIDQLLDFTRIRLGRGLPLDRKSTNLEQVCRLALEDVDDLGEKPVVEIQARGDVVGAWDDDRLSQLISNLLGNALAHGDRASGVRIRIDGTHADVVELTIGNRGCIPADVHAVMFEPFKLPGDRKQERSSGLGLGLYISQQIVHAHAGTIDVASTADAGTCITVRLPRFAVEAEASFLTSLPETS
jgi:PAS domain S-box-containing protein